MRRTSLLFAAAALGAALTCIPRDASALGPIDLELGAKAGGGTNPINNSTLNPLGFGIGARGGVALFGIYGGVNVMYYLGGSQTVAGQNISVHSLMYGAELGYNVKLTILTIRPQLGLGNITLSGTGANDVNNLYLEPGVTGLIALGTWFLGADANALVLPGIRQGDGSTGTSAGFTLHGQVGVKF